MRNLEDIRVLLKYVYSYMVPYLIPMDYANEKVSRIKNRTENMWTGIIWLDLYEQLLLIQMLCTVDAENVICSSRDGVLLKRKKKMADQTV